MCRFQNLLCIVNSSSTGLGDVIGIQTSCMSLCYTSGVLFFHGSDVHVVLSFEERRKKSYPWTGLSNVLSPSLLHSTVYDHEWIEMDCNCVI